MARSRTAGRVEAAPSPPEPAPEPAPVAAPEPPPDTRSPLERAYDHARVGEAEAALPPLDEALFQLEGDALCGPLALKLFACLRAGRVHHAFNIHRYMGLTWPADTVRAGLEWAEEGRRALLDADPALAPASSLDWDTLGAAFLAGLVAEADRTPVPALPPLCRGERPLVVVRIMGGLGNQLFQYAAALNWARRCGGELRVELGSYAPELRDYPRENDGFWMDHLQAEVPRATAADLERVQDRRHAQDMRRFDDALLAGSGDVDLYGFWASHRYFEPVAAEIDRMFLPRSRRLREYVDGYLADLRRPGSDIVALHVRRGDTKWPGNRNRYKCFHPEFYRRAAQQFPPGTTFLVFSDTVIDLDWCKQNIDLGPQYRIAFAELHSTLFDFFLMRACDHAVVSNSTFSWWAAWLMPNPAKIVIAPAYEQATGALYAHSSNIGRSPPGWRTLVLPHEYVTWWK